MSEEVAIREMLDAYIESGRKADSAIMRPIFHADATMYWAADGQIEGGGIEELFKRVDARDPSPDVVAEIGPIDVSHSTATVRVELHNWGGNRFSDQFTLIKTNDGWKIMQKVFHKHG
ncbi:MAG: nuclear transport factor 2 family protein [Hyphomicrobiales bacterium]